MSGEEIDAFLNTVITDDKTEIPVELFSRELLRAIEDNKNRKQFGKVFEFLAGAPGKRISVERLRESMKELGAGKRSEACLTLLPRSAQSLARGLQDQRGRHQPHVPSCRLRRRRVAECQ